ncbi:hypothetical protein L1887_31955 [Cichorium endivia]|nr:hypothetical protein L1887_31955 [Cichorium endivia]
MTINRCDASPSSYDNQCNGSVAGCATGLGEDDEFLMDTEEHRRILAKSKKSSLGGDDSYTQPTGRNIRQALADSSDRRSLVTSSSSITVAMTHASPPRLVTMAISDLMYDDFRDLVDQVPHGCRITIILYSCHSGGLIDEDKEQIDESYKNDPDEQEGSGSEEEETEAAYEGDDEVKRKSLPLLTLIEIQQEGHIKEYVVNCKALISSLNNNARYHHSKIETQIKTPNFCIKAQH